MNGAGSMAARLQDSREMRCSDAPVSPLKGHSSAERIARFSLSCASLTETRRFPPKPFSGWKTRELGRAAVLPSQFVFRALLAGTFVAGFARIQWIFNRKHLNSGEVSYGFSLLV